jgi:shikimate dehydrogenase
VTLKVGLLGWPLDHSVSPAMHKAAFAALGIDGRYDSLPIPPDDLERRVFELAEAGYSGFNVTVPHKRAILRHPLVSELDPDVQAVGAANTLARLEDGTFRVSNTDWRGFVADRAAQGVTVQDAVCLILGTGGSAKAVNYALQGEGTKEIIGVSRGAGEGTSLIGYDDLNRVGKVDLVINCTPVGMFPAVDASPWPEDTPIPKGAVLYDLIYNPPLTRLMVRWTDAGKRAIGGLGMLIRQGALAFELWTGQAPPLDVMEAAAKAALKK